MKSLPSLTLAAIALLSIGYGLNCAVLRGAQEGSPKIPSVEKRTAEPGKKPGGGIKQGPSPDEPGSESPEAKAALDQVRDQGFPGVRPGGDVSCRRQEIP